LERGHGPHHDLRRRLGTEWAYCGFFTKYPLGHFGYASIGGPRIVMAYANDGWGPSNIDRVFAHETGHIFNCPDEYARPAAATAVVGGATGAHQRQRRELRPGRRRGLLAPAACRPS
jgi:hypothetical protein